MSNGWHNTQGWGNDTVKGTTCTDNYSPDNVDVNTDCVCARVCLYHHFEGFCLSWMSQTQPGSLLSQLICTARGICATLRDNGCCFLSLSHFGNGNAKIGWGVNTSTGPHIKGLVNSFYLPRLYDDEKIRSYVEQKVFKPCFHVTNEFITACLTSSIEAPMMT